MLKIAAIVSLMLIVATWSQADHRRHKRDTTPRDFNSGQLARHSIVSSYSCLWIFATRITANITQGYYGGIFGDQELPVVASGASYIYVGNKCWFDVVKGSTLWAASLSCDSCGSECTSACGTRHFRSCCFNYLRRKRGPETLRLWFPKYETMDLNPLFESAPPMHEFQNEYQQYGDDTFDPIL